jgi:hypothetical protein
VLDELWTNLNFSTTQIPKILSRSKQEILQIPITTRFDAYTFALVLRQGWLKNAK